MRLCRVSSITQSMRCGLEATVGVLLRRSPPPFLLTHPHPASSSQAGAARITASITEMAVKMLRRWALFLCKADKFPLFLPANKHSATLRWHLGKHRRSPTCQEYNSISKTSERERGKSVDAYTKTNLVGQASQSGF